MNIESMAELVEKLGKYFTDTEFETVEDVVDAIVELGNSDKVYAFDDDHLGLESNLSPEFLEATIAQADEEIFEPERKILLEQAEITIGFAARTLSEEQIEDVREDYILRGLDPEDINI